MREQPGKVDSTPFPTRHRAQRSGEQGIVEAAQQPRQDFAHIGVGGPLVSGLVANDGFLDGDPCGKVISLP